MKRQQAGSRRQIVVITNLASLGFPSGIVRWDAICKVIRTVSELRLMKSRVVCLVYVAPLLSWFHYLNCCSCRLSKPRIISPLMTNLREALWKKVARRPSVSCALAATTCSWSEEDICCAAEDLDCACAIVAANRLLIGAP
jgi:hypothetical protein